VELVADGERLPAPLHEPNLDLRIVILAGLVPLGRDLLRDCRSPVHGRGRGLDHTRCERQHHQHGDRDAGGKRDRRYRWGSMRALAVRDSLQVIGVVRRSLPPDDGRFRIPSVLGRQVGDVGLTGSLGNRAEYTTDGADSAPWAPA